MNKKVIIHFISILIMIISAFMLMPLIISLIYKEYTSSIAFAITIGGASIISLFFFLITLKTRLNKFNSKDGFFMVAVSWIIASAVGAVPFYLSKAIPSYTDAFFETMSGFTTTGASILVEIEALPQSMLFWRSLTHWLGGMGIVVLTVAILPLLGISGLNLMKAEAPGPSVDKISSKVASTAKILWLTYLGLTLIETLLLLFGGMSLFDSLIHSFGTLATGGFSSKNGSIGHYNSAYIQWVITIFMILAGLNFALYFKLLTGKFKIISKNSELKAYLFIILITTLTIAIKLTGTVYDSFGDSLRFAAFQVASIITTTGYSSTDYSLWPNFTKVILFLLMFIGGSAGSTGGGIKVIRLVTLYKLSKNEMKRLIYPKSVFTIKIDGVAIKKNKIYGIAGFFFLYISFLLVTTLVVAAFGSNILTSFTTALATVGNIGPGFDIIGPAGNYHTFAIPVKWFLSFAMMVGRLEVYTVLVIFIPHFWKN